MEIRVSLRQQFFSLTRTPAISDDLSFFSKSVEKDFEILDLFDNLKVEGWYRIDIDGKKDRWIYLPADKASCIEFSSRKELETHMLQNLYPRIEERKEQVKKLMEILERECPVGCKIPSHILLAGKIDCKGYSVSQDGRRYAFVPWSTKGSLNLVVLVGEDDIVLSHEYVDWMGIC